MITQEQKESKKKSQEDMAIQYMKENGSASVRELFIYCNINSPTKVISNLNKLGIIGKEQVKRAGKMPYVRYYLKEEANA